MSEQHNSVFDLKVCDDSVCEDEEDEVVGRVVLVSSRELGHMSLIKFFLVVRHLKEGGINDWT